MQETHLSGIKKTIENYIIKKHTMEAELEKQVNHFINVFGDYALSVIEKVKKGNLYHYSQDELFERVKEKLKGKEVKEFNTIKIGEEEFYLVPKLKEQETEKKDDTEYYVLVKEYPGSPKIGTQVMVHGKLVNFCSVVYSMDGIPKYDDLIKYNDFWKKVKK